MPSVALSDIVSYVSGRYDGPAGVAITGVAPLSDAGEGEISFLSHSLHRYVVAVLRHTRTSSRLPAARSRSSRATTARRTSIPTASTPAAPSGA